MQTAKVKNLYYKYAHSALPIFDGINLEFHKGWSAIVGSNGSGKTTLLKLMSGELHSEKTTITGNPLSYYCAQSTEKEPQELTNFMMTYSSKAFKIKELLGIKDSWLYQWDYLSHGERKRLQIALALFSECDLLMVDEPSNHLDIKSKDIVLKALQSFKGIGIFVSHDRRFLDTLSDTTILIKNGDITCYSLPYSQAMQEHQNRLSRLQKIEEQHSDKIKKLDKLIQTQTEKVSQSKKRISKKVLDPNDSDARAKINLAKLTGKDKNDGQMLKQIQNKHKRLSAESIDINKVSPKGINFEVKKSKKSFPLIIEAETLELSQTHKLQLPRLSINEHDKISIEGDNGSGKSTFIKYLLSKTLFEDEILYVPQEITQKESQELLKTIDGMTQDKKGALYTLIKRLSSEPKQLIQSSTPSPGEVRKLLIAQGLLKHPSLIVLDEPTNHMDLDSIESLEVALNAYEGTLVIISHDQNFVRNIATIIWSLKEIKEGLYKII